MTSTVPLEWPSISKSTPVFLRGESSCTSDPGGTLDQLYTLTSIVLLEGAREFDQPVHMCFGVLEMAYNHDFRGILSGVLREFRVDGSLLQVIQSLYSPSLVCIVGTKSVSFPVVLAGAPPCHQLCS